MCGHVGMTGNLFAKHREMFRDMLFLDTLRGRHSTGVASINGDGSSKILKKTLPGWEFIDDPAFTSTVSCADRVWIGHNRFATKGIVNRLNAHPFDVAEGQLVGSHNGTIGNHTKLPNHELFGTDSELCLNMIYDNGPKDTVAQLEGAWAFVWYDKRNNTLNFLRNKDRPFFMYKEKGNKVMFWASEGWMIREAAARNQVELEDTEYTFLPNKWYSYPVTKGGDEIPAPFVEEGLEGKPLPPFQETTHYRGGYSGQYSSAHSGGAAGGSQTTGQGQTNGQRPSTTLISSHGPSNVVFMYQKGKVQCYWCDDIIPVGARYRNLDPSGKDVVCECCIYDSHHLEEESVSHQELVELARASATKGMD